MWFTIKRCPATRKTSGGSAPAATREAKDGGLFSVDINGVLIRGHYVRVELTHSGLVPSEAAKHAIGWPHFTERLVVAAAGRDPGPDPWKTAPPS